MASANPNCGLSAVDYWHNVEPLPTFWTEEVEVVALPKAGWHRQPAACRAWQYRLYPGPGSLSARYCWISPPATHQPERCYRLSAYYRAYKTDYELKAQPCAKLKMAVRVISCCGGRGLPFRRPGSFDINGTYPDRGTSRYRCSILLLTNGAERTCRRAAYTKLDHQAPSEMRSFLLDAGANTAATRPDLTRGTVGEKR